MVEAAVVMASEAEGVSEEEGEEGGGVTAAIEKAAVVVLARDKVGVDDVG